MPPSTRSRRSTRRSSSTRRWPRRPELRIGSCTSASSAGMSWRRRSATRRAVRRAGRSARVASRRYGCGGGRLSRGAGEGSAAARGARGARDAAPQERRMARAGSRCSTSACSTPRSKRRARSSPKRRRSSPIGSTIASRRSRATRRWPPRIARDLTVLRALERLYSADGQEAQYIECLGRQADAVESDRERAALYRRMASLWEEIPGSSARAEECLEKLLAVDPRSEDALRSLERLYYAERKWSELIDACRRHAALVPPPNAGEIHFQVGGHLRARAARPRQGDRRLPRGRDGAAEPRRHDGGADPRLREDRGSGRRRPTCSSGARSWPRSSRSGSRCSTRPARSTAEKLGDAKAGRGALRARARDRLRRTCRR